MTGSALDEILPGRFVLGLGTGLPLRLKQMGIPYEPDAAVAGVSAAMDTDPRAVGRRADPVRARRACRRSSRCSRRPTGSRSSSPPTARRSSSWPGRRRTATSPDRPNRSRRCAGSSSGCTRPRRRPAATRTPIETAGYLLSLVDKTRREALNRAKREPFVIYMMSVLSDVSLGRAGFDRELRDRIAAAWRAEDFTTAGNLIPDELLDAFMLCGTREDVAAGAMAFHAGTGLHLPLLQPVLQEDRQIDELIAAAAIYASIPDRSPVAEPGAATWAGSGSGPSVPWRTAALRPAS